jgi:hypothetical protein
MVLWFGNLKETDTAGFTAIAEQIIFGKNGSPTRYHKKRQAMMTCPTTLQTDFELVREIIVLCSQGQTGL